MKSSNLNLVIFVFILAVFGILIYRYINIQKSKLLSPVLGISGQRFADNIWFPNKSDLNYKDYPEAPEITARAAFFVDSQTGEVIYQKDAHVRYPIASLNKIMTAIVALENGQMERIYTVSERAASMEPDEMILLPNEKLTLKELLEGVFLVSANDAAEAISEGTTAGGRDEFIKLMNSKAAQLGMKDTLFLNPTGLDEDYGKQYSSAFDVSLMSRYLINKWPRIVEISSTEHVFIEATKEHQDYDMYSGINLLTTYPGVVGLKTGYTPEAGLTLVTLARKGNHEMLGVLLGATDRRDDAKALLDYSFSILGV